ncbi:protein NO VEIN domain-containing protein [Spongiactinospora rosea]|uniref:protein NO VEIN domain-containing protein n=1 Tax=Spongiactinospora rosea TaxID=2248750 RepID=UPI001314E962|nr:DUF3883 domain-containing protein [Spongiactinospora rosea]
MAYNWLREAGLLERVAEPGPVPQRIFEAAVLGLPWFQDADILVQDPGELPEDALTAAEALGIDRGQAFRHVHALWGKVDLEQRERIGAAGETALVKLLEGSVDAQIRHVSQASDGHGYDIEVAGTSCWLHIEVKTTPRRQRITVFLSRHEYETMIRDPAWQLVAVRLSANLEIEAVCSVPREWIAQNTPRDRVVSGRWESCRLTVPLSEIANGITRLMSLLYDDASPMIDGTAGW